MDEKVLYQVLMWAGAALAAICAVASVVMVLQVIYDGLLMLIPAAVLMAGTIFGAMSAVHFGRRTTGHGKVFANPIENELLTWKQRAHLKHKRGELVMRRALIEIENEADNIVHRQLEAANDPNKPPHQTRFGDDAPFIPEQKLRPKKSIWED